ncbi:ABC transporter substrate-binding protein [Cohnella nanjingensis]|uniref:Extracellular solute-binding protein n=1 Tax=Cohnella nanjingensis TaxID=1387779 RepID=A0A7X0RME6_9BACL|nr:extracellular solute-binding protein [Cohnella nanjingensis]MBB6670041.1 extracellular solute-binding protein [Cohnella nanjingensis]
MLSVSTCATVAIGLLAGCGGNSEENSSPEPSPSVSASASTTAGTEGGASTASDKPATIHMFIASPEYTDAFNAFVKEYKEVKPNVTIELQVTQADYPTLLKTKIASGDLPDVFQTTAGGELEQYAEYSADLTNEPLAGVLSDSAKKNMTMDGKLLGIPFKINLFSLIYNKQLFADAGITEAPKTTAQLEDAIAKLEAKGITPFANGYKEWWVQKHIFQHFLDAESDNPQQLVNDFIAGKTTFKDHPILMKYFDFVDMTVAHGLPKQLEKDFAAETSDFASGKTAIMTGQGAWAEEGIVKINPEIQLGIMGYPINDDPSKSMIITGADAGFRINKDSEVLQETKDFFNWLYTSDYGKTWFPDIAKIISPIKDGTMPNLQMPSAMGELLKTEKAGESSVIYSLDSFHQKFGEIMQGYISKNKTRDQAIEEIQKAWIQLGAAK